MNRVIRDVLPTANASACVIYLNCLLKLIAYHFAPLRKPIYSVSVYPGSMLKGNQCLLELLQRIVV